MTKFKEYLTAHGAILERDSAKAEFIDYLNFMINMDRDDAAWALAVIRNTYEDHAKVRIAFKHMKAGIMDAKTFYKLALRYRFY